MLTGPFLRLQDPEEHYRSGLSLELYHYSHALFFRLVTPLGVVKNDHPGEAGLALTAADTTELIAAIRQGLCAQLPVIFARDSQRRFTFRIDAGADGDGYATDTFMLQFDLHLMATYTDPPEETFPTLSVTIPVRRKALDELLSFLLLVSQSFD